jgi:hypothetical protein
MIWSNISRTIFEDEGVLMPHSLDLLTNHQARSLEISMEHCRMVLMFQLEGLLDHLQSNIIPDSINNQSRAPFADYSFHFYR